MSRVLYYENYYDCNRQSTRYHFTKPVPCNIFILAIYMSLSPSVPLLKHNLFYLIQRKHSETWHAELKTILVGATQLGVKMFYYFAQIKLILNLGYAPFRLRYFIKTEV